MFHNYANTYFWIFKYLLLFKPCNLILYLILCLWLFNDVDLIVYNSCYYVVNDFYYFYHSLFILTFNDFLLICFPHYYIYLSCYNNLFIFLIIFTRFYINVSYIILLLLLYFTNTILEYILNSLDFNYSVFTNIYLLFNLFKF